MTASICPRCQAKGRGLRTVTVNALAEPGVLERLSTRDGFCYCPAPDCEVTWFHPQTGEVVTKTELKVRVGMKETTGPRPICYCFGHDAAEFEADVHRQGHSDLPAEIAGKCKQGLDRCEETNPQGSCCLGNVNRIVQAAKNDKPATGPFTMAEEIDCCAGEESGIKHDK